MKYFFYSFVILLCLCAESQAQSQDYVRDTSYTVRGSFVKYVKDYPTIKLVEPTEEKYVRVSRDITYKSLGKRKLSLDIFANKKKSKNKVPAVIMVHGGGWISGDKSHMEPLAIQLALNNYVGVPVAYRLSPEASYPAAVYDIKDAIIWIKENAEAYNIDTAKIAILGTSAGGQIASLVGMTNDVEELNNPANNSAYSSSVHAVINMDGVLAFHHPLSQEGRVAGLWLGGSYEEATDRWEQASAINHIDRFDPPTLFIHSQYPRFHAGRDEVINQLDEYGIYSEVSGFEACPHTFWLFEPWFAPTVSYTVSFLNKVFAGGKY